MGAHASRMRGKQPSITTTAAPSEGTLKGMRWHWHPCSTPTCAHAVNAMSSTTSFSQSSPAGRQDLRRGGSRNPKFG